MKNTIESIALLKPFLQEAWNNTGFEEFTAVQQKSLPLILEGRDIIVESPTGTGKTLAYLFPLLEQINQEQKDAQVVVLAPTRELVMQILQEVQRFSAGSTIFSSALIGGADMKRQIEKLKLHPQIVVGTPNRILELIQAKKLKMHEVKTIVLDEADQLLKPESINIVKDILKTTLKDRQLLLFSATITDRVEKAGKEMMKQPDILRISKQKTLEQVEHIYFVCERRDKIDLLRKILKMNTSKAIAFVNNSLHFKELAAKLQFKEIELGVLHGDLRKTERETIIKKFREGKFPLLLTTDVSARGLDIEGVTHVIHFDLPEKADDYIHRSGRTGRMGKEGTVVSIVTPFEEENIKKFSKILGIRIQKKTLYMNRIVDHKPSRPKGKPSSPTGKRKKKS